MHQLVSIVVPAYNAAKRIEAALLSIVAQDYPNIEIIVVDDGSSDSTADAAEKALRTSERSFKVIRHDKNMGVPAARNTGLDAITGDYVIFMDADDTADPDYVSTLLGAITENDSDAAFCGYKIKFPDKELAISGGLDPSRQYSAEELVVMYLFDKISPPIWTIIFKTSFLKTIELKFTESCFIGDDLEFVGEAFSRCSSINFTTGCHYIYMQHEDQMTRTSLQTSDKALRRYMIVAESFCRSARYIADYAESPKVRGVAANYLLADALVNVMTGAARQRDKEKFYRTLHAPETRRTFIAGLKYLIRNGYLRLKAELFVKMVALLVVPGLYFLIRSKSWKYMYSVNSIVQ